MRCIKLLPPRPEIIGDEKDTRQADDTNKLCPGANDVPAVTTTTTPSPSSQPSVPGDADDTTNPPKREDDGSHQDVQIVVLAAAVDDDVNGDSRTPKTRRNLVGENKLQLQLARLREFISTTVHQDALLNTTTDEETTVSAGRDEQHAPAAAEDCIHRPTQGSEVESILHRALFLLNRMAYTGNDESSSTLTQVLVLRSMYLLCAHESNRVFLQKECRYVVHDLRSVYSYLGWSSVCMSSYALDWDLLLVIATIEGGTGGS
eukprot:1179490-Prorocentrum_minimum.AAC.3